MRITAAQMLSHLDILALIHYIKKPICLTVLSGVCRKYTEVQKFGHISKNIVIIKNIT